MLLSDAFAGEWRTRILDTLPGVRNVGVHRPLVMRLESDPELELDDRETAAAGRIAAVRMLTAIGDRAAVTALVSALNDKHNLVQRAAIDGLRVVLEDREPLEAGSIFAQINEVERLKALAAHRGRH